MTDSAPAAPAPPPSAAGRALPTAEAPAGADPMVHLEDVTMAFEGKTVLDRVDLKVPRGKITVVMGGSLLSRAIGQACRTLRKIQIIQETFSEFRFRFVPGEGFAEKDLKLLQKKFDEYFGVQLQWEFEKVEDIERERSGKTRLCISRVTSPLVR